ncbi:MAG: DUF72 domain-containing protein [Actinomycetota bacterium]
MIHIGTSGWQYRDWRGVLYPEGLPQGRWLERYAQVFTVVEVNSSFYRLPETATFERWRDATPPGFTFAVKASRFLTHVKRLREPEDAIRLLFERAAGLGHKLGPVLFQLPPRFPVDVGRLRAFLDAMPAGAAGAWEFRDPSWMRDDVLSLLDDAGCAFVLADRPGFRGPMLVTGGWAYVRFHQGTRSGPGYRRDKLRRWAERIATLPARDAWAFFNNDHDGAAVLDARFLRGALGGAEARVA